MQLRWAGLAASVIPSDFSENAPFRHCYDLPSEEKPPAFKVHDPITEHPFRQCSI